MTIRLLSVENPRPDRRAIARVLTEHFGIDPNTANEYTGYLIEGSPVEVSVITNQSSAFRAIRKVEVDYEIVE